MDSNLTGIDFRDFWYLAPATVLAAWGLLVLLVDLALAGKRSPEARRRSMSLLSLVGVVLALIAQAVLVQAQISSHGESRPGWLSSSLADYFANTGGTIFMGTLAADPQTWIFNVLVLLLLGLTIWLSMAWSFTAEWGEYYALLIWAAVGMMLLAASEELVTLFLTLELMTICLYLATAFEKTRRRSAEGGLKYFVYGSVSSALFLFGLSLLYGLSGTTQFEGIRRVLSSSSVTAQGLSGNVAGATALLLLLVGFGFKVAAVPFHMWAPDAYEGAPAPVSGWIATGSKVASFIALMKVFLHAVQPWSHPSNELMGPGWLGVIAVVSAVTMTYGNFAALAQRNLKRMLAYSSIAHAGYMLVGVAAASVSTRGAEAAGSVLYYLAVYAFTNIGAFAVAAWLVRDKKTDDIDDLNGLGRQAPLLGICIVVLMLSLIGIPPFAGFFGKLYMFMEALNQPAAGTRLTLIGLVALGLFNSVVSAFYYVRVLKAMFLREPSGTRRLAAPERAIGIPIAVGALVALVFGLFPTGLMSVMQAAAVPMLTASAGSLSSTISPGGGTGYAPLPIDRREAVPGMAGKAAAPAMTPEQRKAYEDQMKASMGRTSPSPGAPAGPSGKAQPRPAAQPSEKGEAPATKAEAAPKNTP
ncbi:MAG: NADH-quinone oxidoreductase subunit NuoN [Isosphaeraceae bacterium]